MVRELKIWNSKKTPRNSTSKTRTMIPKTAKWIKGLIYFKLLILLFSLLVALLILTIQPSDGFLYGFGTGFLRVSKLEGLYSDSYFFFGIVTGNILVPLLTLVPALIFFNKRIKAGFWICLGLHIFLSLSAPVALFIPILVLILGLQKSTREYFNSKKSIASSEVLDGQL